MPERLRRADIVHLQADVMKDDVLASPVYAKLSDDEKKTIAAALDRYADIGVRIEDNVLIRQFGR